MIAIPEGLRPFATVLPFAIVMVVFTLVLRFARKRAPSQLAELYPRREPAPGTRLRIDRAIFGRGYFSMAWVKIGADHDHLHVSTIGSYQGLGSFSVPLEDVTATPDRYGWMILAPQVVRLSFGRAPEAVMMVWPRDWAKLAQASGGRLRLEAPLTAAAETSSPVPSEIRARAAPSA